MHAYTSGRWIYNEPLRIAERYLKFDVPALKSAIAASSGQSPSDVTSFVKLAEGGFNRVFEATLNDGRRVLARLPYPSTVPKHHGTASEVATMEFLRLHNIPVPRVHGWSSTAENAVGAEYIVMEKIEGVALSEIWPDLGLKQRAQIIKQVVHLEKRLFSLQLPASGSIYFPDDLTPDERSKAAMLPVQGEKKFCVGPTAHYSWWHGQRSSMAFNRGPWTSSPEVFRDVGKRELAWTKIFAKPRLHYDLLYREIHGFKKMSPEPHIEGLKKYLEMSKCLGYPVESYLSRPVLRHPDLSMNNIRVSESLDVVGLIDWQHASILPLCLVAGIPSDFQNYGDPESERMTRPATDLPAEYESVDTIQQARMKIQHARKWTHFFYAGLTMRDHEEHFNAISTKGVTLHQRLYKSAGTPWEGDSITLQGDMINAIQQWQQIVSSGAIAAQNCPNPPISYSDDETRSIMDLHQQQLDMDTMIEEMRDALGVDVMGWVPSDERWQASKALAQSIKSQMMAAVENDAERDGIRDHFPFDNHSEDE
ncbi:uncharacterized protein BDZ99DRAFT_409728 [Mytilinidion resinicola]|uniref:Aminoglycoside phosphotransferase domain-containing protein n=1 Tax=Mytilinidion resinicola TaxID=574789 RepID=A0A6A6YZ54_9PEZI|nr:uncharacterized protein BDZ99DRAFT_409728 [Mytilinidion resinicola]KAF2813723.1 hypothetical protein BDZ99DRAFT_409728 [Mytilinidion resinicola]